MSCRLDDATSWEDFEDLLQLSHSENASLRLKALSEFCPCKVRKGVDDVWVRVFEMTDDPDDRVRYQVVHTLCDGSPKEKEEQVIEALEKMWNDKNDKIKRAVRRALVSYRKTGNWNVL